MAVRKPQAVIASARNEWRFQLEGSRKVWALPLMGSLPAKKARMLSGLASADEQDALGLFVDLIEELAPGLADQVTLDQLREVIEGWQEASGISAGESQGSFD